MVPESDLSDLTTEELLVKAHGFREAARKQPSHQCAASLVRLARCYEVIAASKAYPGQHIHHLTERGLDS